jgi:hypothetical protein
MQSDLFYDEVCLTKLTKIENSDFAPFPMQDFKAKLRFKVFFKKFYPRINLTTLLLTKNYLLNMIKPFSGYENRSFAKTQKPFQKGPEFDFLSVTCRRDR